MEEIIRRINQFITTETGSDVRYLIQNWQIEIHEEGFDFSQVIHRSERIFLWRFNSSNETQQVCRAISNQLGIQTDADRRGVFFLAYIEVPN
jgi:hypothetical protein